MPGLERFASDSSQMGTILCDECREHYRTKPADRPGIHDEDISFWPEGASIVLFTSCVHAVGAQEHDPSRTFRLYRIL